MYNLRFDSFALAMLCTFACVRALACVPHATRDAMWYVVCRLLVCSASRVSRCLCLREVCEEVYKNKSKRYEVCVVGCQFVWTTPDVAALYCICSSSRTCNVALSVSKSPVLGPLSKLCLVLCLFAAVLFFAFCYSFRFSSSSSVLSSINWATDTN